MQEVKKEIDDDEEVGFMFYFIFYGIGTLWLLAGNSIAPNNPLTFTWWTIGILSLIPSLLLLETDERHKSRNCEEAEWYISHYKQCWFASDPVKAMWDYEFFIRTHYDLNTYRGKKYMQLYEDMWANYMRKLEGKKLKDTYSDRYYWMGINCTGSDIYEPKYQGIINDEEKLRAWEPSMKINMG